MRVIPCFVLLLLSQALPAQQATLTAHSDRMSFVAAAGATARIDFESFAGGTAITRQLAPQGISLVSGTSTFGGGTPPTQVVTSSTNMPFPMFNAGTLPSPTRFLSNDLSAPYYATGAITLALSVPRLAVGAFVADGRALAGFEIEVFFFGASLGAIQVGPRSLPASFVGLTSDFPFTEVTFRALDPGDSWGLDDLELGACVVASVRIVADAGGANAANSIAEWPPGTRPQLGNASFGVRTTSSGCGISNAAIAGIGIGFGSASMPYPRGGCGPGAAGEIMIDTMQGFEVHGLQPWNGSDASFPLPIPSTSSLCGLAAYVQGFWLDAQGPSGPVVLSWRVDLTLGV